MNIQYAKYISLVLHGIQSNIPIYPFDVAYGKGGNFGFHYSPDVDLVVFEGELGFAIGHHEDQDSRVICAFTCSDETLAKSPAILEDAVDMGLSAWGGKKMTPEEALSLARRLQPQRTLTTTEFDPETMEEIETSKTFGEISLDENNLLTRTIS